MRIEKHPIINFQRGEKVRFSFNGQELVGYTNETIAVALHAAGIKVLNYSSKLKRPRGFFCAIGNCSSCLMQVNGVSNVRTCIVFLQEGMVVETQEGKGKINETN